MSPAVVPVPQTAFKWPHGVRGALSLTFDDARPSQVEQGVPLFDRFGAHATFYLKIARKPRNIQVLCCAGQPQQASGRVVCEIMSAGKVNLIGED